MIGSILSAIGAPSGPIPWDWLPLLVTALAVSVLGFYRVVWFVSIGYGFSVAAQAVVLALLHFRGLGLLSTIHLALLFLYGVRLSGYLLSRERQAAYGREAEGVEKRSEGLGIPRRIVIWLGVSVLYVAMMMAAIFGARAATDGFPVGPAVAVVGIAVMTGGFLMEMIADLQKARFKKKNPAAFCRTGLYEFVRCPNYFGEILFWTGNLLFGVSVLRGIIGWVAAVAAWVVIVLIMMGSTKRLETKQDERYGGQEEFRQYCATVPVLFPWIPVYTLKNVKVYLE